MKQILAHIDKHDRVVYTRNEKDSIDSLSKNTDALGELAKARNFNALLSFSETVRKQDALWLTTVSDEQKEKALLDYMATTPCGEPRLQVIMAEATRINSEKVFMTALSLRK